MGLDTSHNAWSGPYSMFMEWREAICKAAGFGDLREEFWTAPDPEPVISRGDPLALLLLHSDCDGEIMWHGCEAIATRLEELLPELAKVDMEDAWLVRVTEKFIAGLRLAYAQRKPVKFH